MKQYKLIREYPGSPKLGTICNQLENDTITAYPEFWQEIKQAPPIGTKVIIKGTVNGCYCAEGKIGIVTEKKSDRGGILSSKNFVDDLEVFNVETDEGVYRVACSNWKEIVEKDYEILSYKYCNNIYILTDENNGNGKVWRCRDGILQENTLHCFNPELLLIYSIKRLSDNEIFTVGDEVQNGKILEFRLMSNIVIPTIGPKVPLTANLEELKKVVKKDYEILSLYFIDIDGSKNVCHLCEDGRYRYKMEENSTGSNLEECLKSKWKIHSVKRLSDGKIFTVEDRITGKSKNKCRIHTIELNPNCSQIMFNRLDEGIDLINAKLIKKVLFTTEDGVEVLEGDEYWIVYSDLRITASNSYNAQYDHLKVLKKFSTKKAAEEYILMNKPCLSINDINAYCNLSLSRLQEIAKQKLNL